MAHTCKSWSDALNLAAQKFDILSWGRELDAGKSLGILRLSTPCLKDRHIRAVIYAIELGYEHITELSVHFCTEYSTEKGADRQDPFSPEGCHLVYLQWLGMPDSFSVSSSAKKSVYDRLSESNSSTNRTNYPKDAAKSCDERPLDIAVESKKRLQSMAAFFRSLIKFVPLMQRLKLISFYGICLGFLTKSTVTNLFSAIARNSSVYKQLDGVLIRNCPLGDDILKPAIINLSTALSIRLLVLHTCNLTDAIAGALGAILTAHKNARNNRVWELCLRKYGPTLKESIRSKSQEGHFTLAQLQKIRCMHELKGLIYLDLGYNSFGNELCTELLDSLKDDTYVHSISLDGNKGIKLSTTVMIPKYDNGDLGYIYDNLITLTRNNDEAPAENPHSTMDMDMEMKNNNLPVRMAERLSQIENLEACTNTARSRAEQVVLQSICPDYEPSTKSNVITYLASYARSTDDLKTLLNLKAHPLVQLLLQNTTILHLLLDSSTTPTLLRFVHTRLSENRKLANKNLLEDADKILTREKDIEEAVEELREHENLQGMIKKLKLAMDPINFCQTENPVLSEHDSSTPRRRSRRGKSISQIMNTRHKLKNLDQLDDSIALGQTTPPVDKDVYPLCSSREKSPSYTQSRPQSASTMQQPRTVKRANKRSVSNELQTGQRFKENQKNNIYYSNASSGFSNYSKGPLPFDTPKKSRPRALSAGKNIYKNKEDSDDIPVLRKHKPDPFISKSAQKRSTSQGKTGTVTKTVASTIPNREAEQSLKNQHSIEKSTSIKQNIAIPRQARSRQQQNHRIPTSSKWESPALTRYDNHRSISTDDEEKYTIIHSPRRPVSTSKSTSLVRLSQGVPSNEPLYTSPHTKKKAFKQEMPAYTQVDASALSEIEPVRTSDSPINKPDNHASGIEQSDFNDVTPNRHNEGSRDSFSKALHDNIDAIRLEHYAPPVLTEPSSLYITQEDKNKIYRRLLQDMASSQQASSDYDDTSAELRELSTKAQNIIQNSYLKKAKTINTPNVPKYNFYSHRKEDTDADTDELCIDELSNIVVSKLSQSKSKRLDSADIELKEIDQLLTKAQSMGEELDKSYKRINSLYMETMQDVYGSTTRKNTDDAITHLNQPEPKQVDMQIVDQLLVNNSPPQSAYTQPKSLAEKLAISKISTSGASKWSAYSTTPLTNDELLRSVDSIIGSQPSSQTMLYQNSLFDTSKMTDLDISSMKESIRTNGSPILAATINDESFESVIGLLYTVLMYFTKSDRVEALKVYKINEPRILAYVEEILSKLRSNELHLNEVSGYLYELVASLIKDNA